MVRAKKPAPVSGPGRLSERTDLSPATQPVRTPTGLGYGEAGALEAQQQAAPMQAESGGVPAGLVQGAFGPTQRPDEDITAMAPGGDRPPMEDPDALLRAMYRMTGDPDLERMLLRRRPRY